MTSEQDWSSSAAIVASPAGLVWVRRRNGSWWPGRVVPPEELPVKVAARSGTPIKLLGKEDGSMDWYNLEKSKRVKPFRCGEYDECIEKVKDSASRSSKSASNTGKYVRRDDAILHALKLEKDFFSSGEQIYSGTGNSLVTTVSTQFKKKRRVQPLETHPGYRPNKRRFISETQELSQSVVSFEQPSKLIARNMQLMQKKRQGPPNDLEDDEGIKRMRDLQEIGSGMLSHRKHKMCVHSRWSHDPAVSDKAHMESNHGHGVNKIKINRNSCSSMKNQPHVRAHEFVRRKDRTRELNKVCDGMRVIIPSYCDWDGSFVGRSSLRGAIDANHESTSERTDSLDTIESSDSSGTSSDDTLFNANENIYEVDVDDSDSETKDSELSSMLEFIDDDCTNSLVNIPLVMNENIDRDYPKIGEHHLSGKFQPQAAGKQYNGRSRDGSISRYMENLGESSFTCLASQVDRARQKAQMKALEQYSIAQKIHKHLKNTRKHVKRIGLDFLYDVEVTVQRNNHGPNVPLISLMSKLDGKAIIGHPVPVEILEYGISDILLVRNDDQSARNNIYRSSISVLDMISQKEKVSPRYTKAQSLNYSGVTDSKRKLSNNRKLGFSPRKIRKLSSFSADHKQEKKAVVETMAEPIVACIPVRLVFSRITEALSSSARTAMEPNVGEQKLFEASQ